MGFNIQLLSVYENHLLKVTILQIKFWSLGGRNSFSGLIISCLKSMALKTDFSEEKTVSLEFLYFSMFVLLEEQKLGYSSRTPVALRTFLKNGHSAFHRPLSLRVWFTGTVSFGCSVLFGSLTAHWLKPTSSSIHGFSRLEHWSGLPFCSPGDLPDPELKPRSPALQADSSPSESPGKPDVKERVPLNLLGLIIFDCFPVRKFMALFASHILQFIKEYVKYFYYINLRAQN